MKVQAMKILKNTSIFITALAGVLVLIYLAFFGAVMNDTFLKDVNIKLGTHDKLGMSEEDLGKVAESMIFYTKGEIDTLQVTVTIKGEERPFYNEKELLHIQDVRELVKGVRFFIIGCAIVFVTGTVVVVFHKDWVKLAKGYLIALIIVGVLAAAIGVVAVIDLNAVIDGFHYLFFDNDLWIMNRNKDLVVWFFFNDMYKIAITRIALWLVILLTPLAALSVFIVRKNRNSVKKKVLES